MSNSTFPPIASRFDGAADKAKDAAAIAGETASQAVHVARDLASDACCAVGSMASQAACDVGHKANDLTASAGAGLKGLGNKLSQVAPQTGAVGNASRTVAKAVHDGGQYMEDAKFTGIVDDVAHLIRRNPIPAVFLAIGLGWVVARKLRS